MENIKREQFKLILSSILITIGIIIFSILIANKLVNTSRRTIYLVNNLLVDIEPTIDYILEKDITKNNRVNVTNNGTDTKYQIIMNPTSNMDENIIVSLNNSLRRPLKNFAKEDGHYILYENTIKQGYTMIIDISLYSNNNSIKSNFKLNVKEVGDE